VTAWRRLGPLAGAAVGLLLVFRLFAPGFLATPNLVDLAQQISVNAILAFGMTLVILIGGIDLSVGAVVALVGTTAAYALVPAGLGWPAGWAVLLGLLVAGVFGIAHGMSAAWTAMPPFIITLGTMMVARGCALRFNQGRPMNISDQHAAFLAIGNGRVGELIPVPVLIMLVLFAIMVLVLHSTVFGRYIYAIGGNRTAALYSGVPVARCQIAVYLLASLLAGVAGMIHTSQLYSAEPGSGVNFELNAIAAAVVGGTSFNGGVGTMPGTLIGAIIIGILDKGLNQAGVHFSLQYMVKGVVILAAVYIDVRRRGRT
jgi:ribose transport system permease protein